MKMMKLVSWAALQVSGEGDRGGPADGVILEARPWPMAGSQPGGFQVGFCQFT